MYKECRSNPAFEVTDQIKASKWKGPLLVRFGVAPTYRCNQECRWCNRFLDLLPWPDSDMRLEDVRTAGELLREHGIVVGRIRFTGGEPLMHPRIGDLCREFQREWNPLTRMHMFTNGSLGRPRGLPARVRSTGAGKAGHMPWMVSPADLGIATYFGYVKPCRVQWVCGRLFDAFGFSFCIHAGSLGRLLGIDPYSGYPQMMGRPEICRHCICSVPIRKGRNNVQRAAMAGEFEHPTKTFRDAMENVGKDGPMVFPKFRGRLDGSPTACGGGDG